MKILLVALTIGTSFGAANGFAEFLTKTAEVIVRASAQTAAIPKSDHEAQIQGIKDTHREALSKMISKEEHDAQFQNLKDEYTAALSKTITISDPEAAAHFSAAIAILEKKRERKGPSAIMTEPNDDYAMLATMMKAARNGKLDSFMDNLAKSVGYRAKEFDFTGVDSTSDLQGLATAKGRYCGTPEVTSFIRALRIFISTTP
jgi:hypothetical protein